MRLTKKREAELRHYYGGTIPVSYYRPTMANEYAVADVADLLAELDAVRAERDEAEARGRAAERAKGFV